MVGFHRFASKVYLCVCANNVLVFTVKVDGECVCVCVFSCFGVCLDLSRSRRLAIRKRFGKKKGEIDM